MFAYLKGQLVNHSSSQVILEVNGVGYLIFIHSRVSGQLPALGELVHFYTTFVIREFSQTLYGFLDSQEKDLFEVLMNVSGIGPKLALSLLGHLTLNELHTAVSRPDLPTLCRVPGVGKKTAERLIVELKDKLPLLLKGQFSDFAMSTNQDAKSIHLQDAMLALINLGYNQNSAQKALKQSIKDLPETADLALLITTALKHI